MAAGLPNDVMGRVMFDPHRHMASAFLKDGTPVTIGPPSDSGRILDAFNRLMWAYQSK
jgi:hypothetical protein